MIRIVRVKIVSRDLQLRVHAENLGGALASTFACAQRLKLSDFAVRSTQEAVIHAAPVNVVPHDRPPLDDAPGDGALARLFPRMWSVERDDRGPLGHRRKAQP